MRRLLEWVARRLPTRVIMDHVDPSREYLHRSYLLGGSRDVDGKLIHRRFEVCLHKILCSDDDWLHSHPSAFFSLILAGSYREHTPEGAFVRRPGHMRVRSRYSLHRLELIDGPVYTLFAFLNRTQDGWGFLVDGKIVPHEVHLKESA
jgi:hypothetical protein